MPFTLSHAGFVLPLRTRVSHSVLAALMIGSAVPDFGYFVRQFGIASFAHTAAGAVLVSLPIGLALYTAIACGWRRLVAPLPEPHRGYLGSAKLRPVFPSGRSILAVAAAVLAGALAHNFVDSFTHQSGDAVKALTILESPVGTIAGEPLPTYRVLQYVGSAVGLAMIAAIYVGGLLRRCRKENQPLWQDTKRWAIMAAMAGATLAAAAAANWPLLADGSGQFAIRAFGFKVLITWIPLFAVLWVAAAWISAIASRHPQ